MGVRTRASSPGGLTHSLRYLNFVLGNPGALQLFGSRVFWDTGITVFTLICVPFPITIDRLYYVVGNVGAGNRKMAIYADNGGRPDGGALLGSVAGAAQAPANCVDMGVLGANLVLQPGLYWIAVCHDAANGSFIEWYAPDLAGVGWFRLDTATGYANFPLNPCPVTAYRNAGPGVGVRVVSVP